MTGAHLDVLERGLRNLSEAERRKVIADDGERLARLACRQSPDEFARTVKETVIASRDDGGIANLERQKRAARLKAWTDQFTGMVHLSGQFDPESGLKLLGRLRNKVEELFHDKVPDTCPTDPNDKQDHLRALALISILDSTGTGDGTAPTATPAPRRRRRDRFGFGCGSAGPDRGVDEQTLRTGLHEHSIVDLGADTVLPVETLRRMACVANIIPVVLDSNGVVLDVGYSARLATKAQRRAMRAMYPSCGVPGCRVAFEQCVLHHIRYWENGGRTDMANLIPLCSKHHHAAHEGGWHLALHPTTRQLTITYPDGTIQTTGPPHARAG